VFDRLKKKPEPQEPPKAEVTEKPIAPKKLEKNMKRPRKPVEEKPAEPAEDAAPQVPADLKEAENAFVGIKEYSSAVEIAGKIDREIAATKSTLGKYLRRLDDKRTVAEKTKKLHDVVAKLANKKETKENPDQIDVNGLAIVLDATPLNELTAMESVVKSHQERLLALQKVQEALESLDQVGDAEGIRYLVLEREGIPERILLKLS
jgi:hypothetical protein